MAQKDYFKNKRIAVIGLGPHGELVPDIKYLLKTGAIVSFYDMKSESRIRNHITFLRSVGLLSHVCGGVPAEDLLDMDLIIISHEYTKDASFLKLAREKDIPIEFPDTLFFKLSPPITFVGIMGSYGTSTVFSMLAPILDTLEKSENTKIFYLDPDSNDGVLNNLKTIKNGDLLMGRITPEIMLELGQMRISPHVAIFTSVPGIGSYIQSPFEILNYQTYNNFIIGHDSVIDNTHKLGFQTKAKMIRTRPSIIPNDWEFSGNGKHDRDNLSLAVETARLFKIEEEIIRDLVEKWKPLKGRIEMVKKTRNAEFINDATSISPDTTLNTLEHLGGKANIIIMGGSRSAHDYRTLLNRLGEFVHTMVLMPGSGTLSLRKEIQKLENIHIISASSLEDAVFKAYTHSNKGDRIIFSPAFPSFEPDSSRKDLSDRFVRAVRALK